MPAILSKIHPLRRREHPEKSDIAFPFLAFILRPVFEFARASESLLAGVHPIDLQGERLEIPQFLLLGQSGGAKPIRIAFFSGLDAGSTETVEALSGLFGELAKDPGPARDYMLFGYPVVNLAGFGPGLSPLWNFETRYAADKKDGDVRFFKNELRNWAFDGLVVLRTDPNAESFHANTRGTLIARDVVQPAIQAAGKIVSVKDHPLKLRPSDAYARRADLLSGRLIPPLDAQPYPFEIELFAPGNASLESRVHALQAAIRGILSAYRLLISHAQNL